MPGAYAHITLVNELREPRRLEQIPGFPQKAITAILDYFRFCELGAVSPDYPYLAIRDKRAAKWADTMHYSRTGEIIHAGVRYARGLKSKVRQRKVLAWLLGYAAHVATDVTIHPVIELKVGPYAKNKDAHRTCEMHQDTYIFQRLNLGEIGVSEHLDSGICRCGKDGTLDNDIKTAWRSMLRNVHPADFKANTPDMDKWYRHFNRVVDIAEEGNRLIPIARHVAAGSGLTYPSVSDVDLQYIKDLKVPGGNQHYNDIFDRTVENVAQIWAVVARGVLEHEDTYIARIGNWDLDTGRDGENRLVFWS